MPLYLNQLLDQTELEKNIQDGLINVQTHPSLPLRIFNYSHSAASENNWTKSMSLCRGLIVDDGGIIIARPFQKFWNHADPRHPETMPENLPTSLPEMTVKQDGSLLIGFNYKGQIGVATRGSFTSDQAIWAGQFVKEKHSSLSWLEGWTPLWEMIAKFNRIVVDHGDWEGLIALSLVNNKTGEEAGRPTLESWAAEQGFIVTPLVNKHLEVCAAEDLPNFEGYVAKWHMIGVPPLRTKIKLETYTKLHRILTGFNQKTVWEMLAAGQHDTVEVLLLDESLPISFKEWLHKLATDFMTKHQQMKQAAQQVFAERPAGGTRKDHALYFKQAAPELSSILFAMLDGKETQVDKIVWDKLKPYGGATFKKDGE